MKPEPASTEENKAIKTLRSPQEVQHAVPNLQADARQHYVVEWGGRVTDGALVFHFFPPLSRSGAIGEWPDDSTMDKRLDRAIPATFDTNRVSAGFQTEWNSFYVIAGGYASSIDVRLLVKKFLDRIDRAF